MANLSINSSTQSPTPGRWERIKAAYAQSEATTAEKPIGEKIKDQFLATCYFAKGVGVSGLKLLETGVKFNPVSMAYQSTQRFYSETGRMITDFDGWKAGEQAKLNAATQFVQQGYHDPRKVTGELWDKAMNYATDKAVGFIQAPVTEQAEGLGKLSGDMGLLFVGLGELQVALKGTKAVEGLSLLERGLIASEGAADRSLLQGGLKLTAPALETVSVGQSAARTAQVLEAGGLQLSQGLSKLYLEGIKLSEGLGKASIELTYDPLKRSWTSPAGLEYKIMENGDSRIQHVLEHMVPNLNKATHTVFNCKPKELLPLLDEAWMKRGPALAKDPFAHIVDMGRVIGTQGETTIRMVVNPKNFNLISAYPVK